MLALYDRDFFRVQYVEMEEGSCHTADESVLTIAAIPGIERGGGVKSFRTQEDDDPKNMDVAPADF